MTALRTARDAVRSLWTTNWPAPPGVPVFWRDNTEVIVPDDPAAVPAWLHLAVEFDGEGIAAYGGGRFANDRRLFGSVILRVFAARGLGEDAALDLLDSAVAVFRARREGGLSFIGSNTFPAPIGRLNGLWWERSALLSFEFRYQG